MDKEDKSTSDDAEEPSKPGSFPQRPVALASNPVSIPASSSKRSNDEFSPVERSIPSQPSTSGTNRPGTPQSPGRLSPAAVHFSRSPTRSPFDLSSSPEAAGIDKLQKMILAHEIALNDQFSLRDVASPPPPHTIEAVIRETVQQAFWDALRSSLSEEPYNYDHAMVLLEEIRETLLSFLPRTQEGHSSQLRQTIANNLDLDHIRSRAELGVLDLREVADFVISMMGKLCAPARDEEVRKLSGIEDTVTLFREVFRVLEEMKVDMINFTLSQVKPVIAQHAVEYEQQMFDEFLATQPDPLHATKEWLRQTAQQLLNSSESEPQSQSSSSSSSAWRVSPMRILRTAFVNLLDTTIIICPETLVADISRIESVQQRCSLCVKVASVMLITQNTAGKLLTGIQDFKSRLKDEVKIIFESDGSSDTDGTLVRVAEHVCAQLISKTPEAATVVDDLKTNIARLQQVDHPVVQLLVRRVKEFANAVLSGSARGIPAGLTCVEEELTQSIGLFARVVGRNQTVFGKYYSRLISSLAEELPLKNQSPTALSSSQT